MTPRPSVLPMLALFVGIVILVATISAQANGRTFVFVNGYELSAQELYAAQMRSGARIPPGNYTVGGTGDGCVYTTFGWSNC